MYLYPKWLRLWHLINALAVIILIVTGIKIRYSGEGAGTAIEAVSGSVTWHNISATVLTIGYLAFVAGNILTGNGKHYRLKGKDLMKNIKKQFRYYIK
ncbi:MAG: cytochrome b/b6 domain-containing protein, partial [Bacteroidales bacterium]|nr:cytochrome b/b6 domain-containing protein [Bacteroidales bacterium]